VDAASFLLSAGANMEQGNLSGWPPLLVAAQSGRVDVANVLLDAGANKAAVTTAKFLGAAAGSTPVTITSQLAPQLSAGSSLLEKKGEAVLSLAPSSSIGASYNKIGFVSTRHNKTMATYGELISKKRMLLGKSRFGALV
jgi:ankyrin repeat protein